MSVADLYAYVSTEIGWFHFVAVVLVCIIAYQAYKIHELNVQVKDIWHWCELTEKMDHDTHKRIEKLERH